MCANHFVHDGDVLMHHDGQRGQSLVEMALLLPVFVLIMMALFDFGRAIYAYNTVSNAARDGARLAIVDQRTSGPTYLAAIEAANQATGLGLDPNDTNEVLVQFPDPLLNCSDPGIGCPVSVTVRYSFAPITPIVGSILGPFEVSSTTELPIESTRTGAAP